MIYFFETMTSRTGSKLGAGGLASSKRSGLQSMKKAEEENGYVWKVVQTLLSVLGIYVCFLSQGVMQESIYSAVDSATGQKFRSPIWLVGLVCTVSAMFGYILNRSLGSQSVLHRTKSKEGVHPAFRTPELFREGFLISLSYVAAMVCTNFALTRINYPSQVLVKSAKAVPVIVGGFLLYGKRYPLADYLTVTIVTVSLLVFQYENVTKVSSKRETQQSMIGFVALFFSLVFDGVTGPRQDRLVGKYQLGTGDLMLLINIFAAPICFILSSIIEGSAPYAHASSNASSLIPRIIGFVLCGSAGQIFIVQILRNLGSLHLTLITTTRKFFAILVSVLWFGHSLSNLQWAAVAFIFSSGFFKYIMREKRKSIKRD